MNKTKKEYPATHSMSTAWFAIDSEGNVAIMECDDNGPAPMDCPRERFADGMILSSLVESDCKIRYTDEQLSLMVQSGITPEEYLADHPNEDFTYIWADITEIDPKKLPLLKEAATANPENQLICISDELNLWHLEFSTPYYYIDESSDRRYRHTKQKYEANIKAQALYKKLFEERVILRIVMFDWWLDPWDEEESKNGSMRKEDSPFTLYYQVYDSREPLQRIHLVPDELSVKESQLPKSLREEAIRFPLRFKDNMYIQLAKYVLPEFNGGSDWIVDGQKATIVKMPDQKYYFVGNRCFFQPVPLDEAFESHDVVYDFVSDYSYEYIINGKRGYLKSGNGPFKIAGSEEIYEPKDTDVIQRIEKKE